MPTNNAKGLEEVLGLLGRATPGEWEATAEVFDRGGWEAPFRHITVYSDDAFVTTYSTDYAEYPDDEQNTANAAAFAAAVNYLRSHGAAWAELHGAIVESRAATQAFANDGHPFNFARYEASERRLEAALRQVEGK